MSSAYDDFINDLVSAPERINPAIELAARVWQAEAQGDPDVLERAVRSGEVERAIADGEREGRLVINALAEMGHVTPCSAKKVPIGF